MNATELLEQILAIVPAESPETGRVVNVELRNRLFQLQTLVSGLTEERGAAVRRADQLEALAATRLLRLEHLEQALIEASADPENITALIDTVRQRVTARERGEEDGNES